MGDCYEEFTVNIKRESYGKCVSLLDGKIILGCDFKSQVWFY